MRGERLPALMPPSGAGVGGRHVPVVFRPARPRLASSAAPALHRLSPPMLAALLVACAAACGPTVAPAEDPAGTGAPSAGAPSAGVGGFVRPGAWIPVRIEAPPAAAAGGPALDSFMPVTVKVTDGDGLRLRRELMAKNGVCLVQAGRAESDIWMRRGLADSIPDSFWGEAVTLRPGVDFTVLAPDERLWAAVDPPATLLRREGEEQGGGAGPLDRTGRPVRVAAFESGDDLPTVAGGLGSVRVLLIESDDLPADDGFLRDWVAGGGHLVVSLGGGSLGAVDDGPGGGLPEWIPLTPGPPVPLTARAALERLAKSGSAGGTATAINQLDEADARPLDEAAVRAANGRVRARGDGGTLVAEVPVGFGRVTVVAVSLQNGPLRIWGGLPSFLLELTRTAGGGAAPAKSVGGEIAEQVFAALEAEHEGGTSPGAVGAWVLVLLLVVGPLDYLLVHRLLNRPALTWVTLPIWLGGATALALWGAGEPDPTPRRLEIVDVDAAAGLVRGTAWASVPAPAAGRVSVQFAPTPTFPGDGTMRLGYAAEPGATFGGLYRGGGVGLGESGYRITGAEAVAVPLPERSAKRLRLDWSGTLPRSGDGADEADGEKPGAGLFAASLTASGGGLSGTISHSLPGTLTDFFLVHDARVYRPDPSRVQALGPRPNAGTSMDDTLPPGVAWRPDGAGVVRRDLTGFLTQVREVRDASVALNKHGEFDPLKFDDSQRLVRSRYAAESRDFGVILPALSLYAQSGGAGFTKQSNAELEGLDLSATAETGRALLFGRLDTPLTTLDVRFGEASPCARSRGDVRPGGAASF